MEFYSNGKLLLSGEYAIMDGALGWAIPTRFGQHLKIVKNKTSTLRWRSIDFDGKLWFEAIYNLDGPFEISSSDKKTSRTLLEILSKAKELNPLFLRNQMGYEVETKLTFSRKWGLGSSSTLINNIAKWANVDAFQLQWQTLGGSGYDIACAQHKRPILYHIKNGKPLVEEIDVKLPFKHLLFFVYINKKQNSAEAVSSYKTLKIDRQKLVSELAQITLDLVHTDQIEGFELLLSRHEQLLSEVLEAKTVKELLFPDYFGAIKSLGAWGGDFIMATGNEKTTNYFYEKGYSTVIPYSKMILE